MERKRMIFDLPEEIQCTIRLVGIKRGMLTGQVITDAMKRLYPDEFREATEWQSTRKQRNSSSSSSKNEEKKPR